MDHVVDIWFRASVGMGALCKTIGAEYVHVIQPNQFFSKKQFSEQERAPSDEAIAAVPRTFAKLNTNYLLTIMLARSLSRLRVASAAARRLRRPAPGAPSGSVGR